MALDTLKVIALGEFIPSDWIMAPLKESLKQDEEDASIVSNMGAILVIFIAILTIIVLVTLCLRCNKPGSKLHGVL